MSSADDGLLFDPGEWWQDEWQDMPEFTHDDLQPWKSILVHFGCREDMEAFAKLIAQTVSERTRFVWFPEAEISTYADKRYANGSTNES